MARHRNRGRGRAYAFGRRGRFSRSRRSNMKGVMQLDMGNRVGNVVLGASISTVGQVVAPRIPFVGEKLQDLADRLEFLDPGPAVGLLFGLGVAAYQYYGKKKRQVGMDIALGAAIPAIAPLLTGVARKVFGTEMGYITAELSAVTATLSDGSSAGGFASFEPTVMQGLGYGSMSQGPYAAQVLQAAGNYY